MSTEEIFWDDKSKLLLAPLLVVITSPNFTVRGDSLSANLKTERITLRGRVNGESRGGSPVKPRPS
jgi:hypothetical protein